MAMSSDSNLTVKKTIASCYSEDSDPEIILIKYFLFTIA
jgi:hypothetical protein